MTDLPLTPEQIATLETLIADEALMDEVIEAAKADDLLTLERLIHGDGK